MPARIFNYGVPPQRLRTFLVLFALALTAPLVGLAIYALTRMASFEQAETEGQIIQVAESLAADIDRELDRAVVVRAGPKPSSSSSTGSINRSSIR